VLVTFPNKKAISISHQHPWSTNHFVEVYEVETTLTNTSFMDINNKTSSSPHYSAAYRRDKESHIRGTRFDFDRKNLL
jgi:hypothetical protein